MKRLYPIILILFASFSSNAQLLHVVSFKYIDIPEPVTNAAMCGYMNDSGHNVLYYFGGLDSTKSDSGIHLRSFKVNLNTKQVIQLPDLPDTMGKIAAAASCIGDKIYIIGGYHVFPDKHEVTSNKVHVFDIKGDSFMDDAAPLPVPVDDHVQFTYRDSLIYCITGWSNNGNVNNVQIFNPDSNKWVQGTPVPALGHYRVFGASGNVLDSVIYYLGGAASGGPGFETKNFIRRGIINPNDPTDITWISDTPTEAAPLYRSVCMARNHDLLWYGGSTIAYNYDGISYDDTTKVKPQQNLYFGGYKNEVSAFFVEHEVTPMDLRGYHLEDGEHGSFQAYFVGGMDSNQKVLKQITVLSFSTGIKPLTEIDIKLYPNPASNEITIENKDGLNLSLNIYSPQGQLVKTHTTNEHVSKLSVDDLPNGTYFVQILNEDNIYYQKIVVQH